MSNAFTLFRPIACSLFLVIVGGLTNSFAEDIDRTVPASDALQDSIWYDAETGQVKPIVIKPQNDDSLNRHSRWLPKAQRIRQRRATTTGGTSGGNLTIGNFFGWLLIAMFILSTVGFLVYAISKAEIELGSGATVKSKIGDETVDQQTMERMKHLPAELRRDGINLRSEAERLKDEGQFDQAIILLFGHQLLMLDKAGMLRLTRGKTNGKYVRETRSADRDCGTQLRATATAFERSYFGRHEINADEFHYLWENNSVMERRVDELQGVAV